MPARERVALGLLKAMAGAMVYLVGPGMAFAQPAILATADQAYIAEDEGGQAWTIGNAAIAFRVGRNSSTGGVTVLGLDGTGDAHWNAERSADLNLQSGTTRLTPGAAAFPFRAASAAEAGGGVRLSLVYEDPAHHLRITRVYACYPTAPVIETWAVLEAMGAASAVPVSDIGLLEMVVSARTVRWLAGLSGNGQLDRFTSQQDTLAARGRFDIGASGRSSETALPIVALGGDAGQLVTGLLWSGAWNLSLRGPDPAGQVTLRWTPGTTETTVPLLQPLELPHVFFGVTGADPADATLALERFVEQGLRQGRPFEAQVTYNTWFAYGILINEETLRAQMDRAAALGAELFVVDAGWYVGGTQASDFTTGLGAWTADTRRFPSGLAALADHAHALGMKFGLWIEPERVDTRLLNRSGIVRERSLAEVGGRYNAGVKNESATAAQICLGDTEGRQWVLDQLVRLIDQVRPDYLKWDNNYWINCDRGGHGHGARDGNFAHVTGLYAILAALRQRYPGLVIENCASGGNRLDFGMLRYTDTGWMDDVSAPSTRVRHNLEGLGSLFPAGYLLSFVMDDPAEPIHGDTDMAATFRARMGGVLGMSFRAEEFSDDDVAQMTREVVFAKRIRDRAPGAITLTLGPQIGAVARDQWDAIELYSPSTGTAVLLAYAGDAAADGATFALRLLEPETRYVVRTLDGRRIGDATGAELMEGGVAVARSPDSAAQIFIVTKLVDPSELY